MDQIGLDNWSDFGSGVEASDENGENVEEFQCTFIVFLIKITIFFASKTHQNEWEKK